jgi:hypothetical protein
MFDNVAIIRRGSHITRRNPAGVRPSSRTTPESERGTMRSTLRQSGLTAEEVEKLL